MVGASGYWNRLSRTRTLVKSVLDSAATRVARETVLFDFIDSSRGLGATFSRSDADVSTTRIIQAVEQCDALVAGGSVYKGAYTGIFKHFFDLFDREALAGKPVVTTATGAAPFHESILDYHLRPLFLFFDAWLATRGLYALTDDFVFHQEMKLEYQVRVERSVDKLSEMMQRCANSEKKRPTRDVCDRAVELRWLSGTGPSPRHKCSCRRILT